MATPEVMSRDEVDQAIAGLGAAYDRISVAMYELDGRAGLGVLRGGGLRGETSQVAQAVLARTDILWSHFAALGAHLQEIEALRGTRSRPGEDELRALTTMLREPVVGLSADGFALGHPTDGPVASRLTVPELTRRLDSGSADANSQVGRVEAACAQVAARWEPLSSALDEIRSAATTLGADALPSVDLDAIGARLGEAHQESLHDPLAAAAASGAALETRVRTLAGEIDGLSARLAELKQLRDSYPQRMERLRATVTDVATAEQHAGQASTAALAKIANPGLPAVPASAAALCAHLAQLDQLHSERRWASLARELPAAERSAAAALSEAAQARTAADGLLERRTELRGRLDAYRARAARLGLAEHTELSALHASAQELLYTSPCDLRAATRAVVAYQGYLNAVTERTPPAGMESPT